MAKSNPATRLINILKGLNSQKPNVKLREAWASVFNLPSSSTIELYRKLIEFEKLVDEVEESIKNLENENHKRHLDPLSSIREISRTSNLDIPWSNLNNKLSSSLFTSLGFT